MKDEKPCGCKKCKEYRKLMKVSECFGNKTNTLGVFEAYTFQKNKPFKVTFNEGLNVSWEKQQLDEAEKPKKLTKRDTMQKEKMVKSLKGRMGEFKKRYGKRAKGVMYAVATKYAKKTP
jgi:hypothetical protein